MCFFPSSWVLVHKKNQGKLLHFFDCCLKCLQVWMSDSTASSSGCPGWHGVCTARCLFVPRRLLLELVRNWADKRHLAFRGQASLKDKCSPVSVCVHSCVGWGDLALFWVGFFPCFGMRRGRRQLRWTVILSTWLKRWLLKLCVLIFKIHVGIFLPAVCKCSVLNWTASRAGWNKALAEKSGTLCF